MKALVAMTAWIWLLINMTSKVLSHAALYTKSLKHLLQSLHAYDIIFVLIRRCAPLTKLNHKLKKNIDRSANGK